MPAHGHNHLRFHAAEAQRVQERDLKDAWDTWTSQVADGWNDLFGDKSTTTTSAVATQKAGSPVQASSSKAATTTAAAATHTTNAETLDTAPTTTAKSKTSPDAALAAETSLPLSLTPESTDGIGGTLAVATSSPSVTAGSVLPVGTGAAATPSTSATVDNTDDTSAAAKAGIVIGVLAGILILGMGIFFLFNRKKRERQRLEDDEKINGPFSDAAAIPPSRPTKAPRLSLRPVTQFLPNLNTQVSSSHAQSQQYPDRRTSRGVTIPMNAVAADSSPRSPWERQMSPAGGSPWERPMTSGSNNTHNPFADSQRIPEEPPLPPMPVSPIESEHEVGVATSTDSPPSISPLDKPLPAAIAAGAAGAAAGAGAVGLTRKTSIRKDAPKALDLTKPVPPLGAIPASPAGTEYSMNFAAPGQALAPSAGAAAIAAAGGPAQSTVHRVQLDFNPTLEDEMGLQAGQLVRLLHEYDDGWALCIRLDRSQQGVVPRTCLSTRPVKPKQPQGGPRGPPVNPQRGPGPNYPPGQRPMTPQGRRPSAGGPYVRPESPMRPSTSHGTGPRPQSPAGGPMGRPMSPGPRSQSPGPRSQSPGPQYQPQGRPQSPNQMRRMSPPHGPSPMSQEYRPGPPSGPVERKPVPGQAY
ncbi:hypothetical protein GQ53DRAFT_774310 [Thozetella sp. PMI_491]|nr:hypothetical protein GQ53DRAFT_774310 [Thozetella sp. PMI_491]